MVNFGSFEKPRPKTYIKPGRENDEINVLGKVEENHVISCRKIEETVGVSKTRSQKILRKYKYTPYKSKVIQYLNADDHERRTVFCRWYLQQAQENRHFGRNVIWSDESFISSTGIFNRKNNRFWSNQNNFVTFERQQQGRFGFNVSCFILGGRLVYHIFDGNLNGARYIEILDTCLPQLLDNIPLAQLRNIYFQQDGAPCHNTNLVRDYLNEKFRNQWIGNNGPVRWPARSPDLSVLDFFLWGFLKNKIYQRRHENHNQLLNATREAFEDLRRTSMYLFKAIEGISHRCEVCLQHNGTQFEQYLE